MKKHDKNLKMKMKHHIKMHTKKLKIITGTMIGAATLGVAGYFMHKKHSH